MHGESGYEIEVVIPVAAAPGEPPASGFQDAGVALGLVTGVTFTRDGDR